MESRQYFYLLESKNPKKIAEVLSYIKSKGINIHWKSFRFNDAQEIEPKMFCVIKGIPMYPRNIYLYKNKDVNFLKTELKRVLRRIVTYDDYDEALMDNEEVMEIKKILDNG